MDMNRTITMGIYVVLIIYILYRIFLRRNPNQDDYEKKYNEILNSDKYKVKGQYDKDD